jgi:hypothetical protein
VRFLMRSLECFNLPNPFSPAMALQLTHPLTERNTRNFPKDKGQPMPEADLTPICEPIAYKMWEPQYLNPMGFHGQLQG